MKNFIFLAILIFGNWAQAILPFEDATSPELVTSARALAMGNAYMSKVDDGWSAFYNPAGLGTVRGLQFHLTNVHLETNNGFLDITSDGGFTDSLSKYQKAFTPGDLRTLHAENPGNTDREALPEPSLARKEAFRRKSSDDNFLWNSFRRGRIFL